MAIKAILSKANLSLYNDFILAIRAKNPAALQPIVLFGAMVISMGLNFISSIFTARFLGPGNYGDFKYIYTVWSLLTLVVTFGYFYSGSRVLVLENDADRCRQISGTLILISIIMGIIISLVTALIAYPMDHIFHVNLANLMIPLAPLILIMPLSQSLYLILQSTNHIYLLGILTAAPSALYMISIFVLSEMKQISIISVLLAQQLTLLIVIIFILVYIKPSIKTMKYWWGEINKHHKTYGLPVYRGALAGIGSTYITRLAISYWVNNTAIGFYSLASSLNEPLTLLPNAIATSSFRSFAKKPKISNKILLATTIISLISLVFAFIFFGTPLSWIYTTKFIEVGPLARALSLAAILLGFGDLFNRFLGAHGIGKSIQNAAYANGIVSVICTFIFIPLIGTWGAVLAMIIANGMYFLLLLLGYRTFSRKKFTEELQ
jgi:O-antigen/teichoic acid export membrane protein